MMVTMTIAKTYRQNNNNSETMSLKTHNKPEQIDQRVLNNNNRIKIIKGKPHKWQCRKMRIEDHLYSQKKNMNKCLKRLTIKKHLLELKAVSLFQNKN